MFELPWWGWLLVAIATPFLLYLAWFGAALSLLATVWLVWAPRGRYALIVYSNSPTWQSYFETKLLPAAGSRAVVLNWSERRRWRWTLSRMLFNMFAGSREFNPIAIVFRPGRWPERYRYFRPFRAFKHGKPDEVDGLSRQLVADLDELTRARAV